MNFRYILDNKSYTINVIYPTEKSNYNIPYILILPDNIDENSMMVVETNNYETTNFKDLLNDALYNTAYNLTMKFKNFNTPLLVPIIPSVKNGIPYFQQLSSDCFNLPSDHQLYRLDIQIVNIIHEVQEQVSKKININKRIFLYGYSTSGVFAQRFSLLHPELINTLCVGGASGSIPIPTKDLNYPLGIKDFEYITKNKFNFEKYQEINFVYFVGELEEIKLSDNRLDEFGNKVPMHDMSYFYRSTPKEDGIKFREMFGKSLIKRSMNEINYLKNLNFNIEQIILPGRCHNNYKNYLGVNELGTEIAQQTYLEKTTSQKHNNLR